MDGQDRRTHNRSDTPQIIVHARFGERAEGPIEVRAPRARKPTTTGRLKASNCVKRSHETGNLRSAQGWSLPGVR